MIVDVHRMSHCGSHLALFGTGGRIEDNTLDEVLSFIQCPSREAGIEVPLVTHTEDFLDGHLTRIDLSGEVRDDEFSKFFTNYTAESLRPHQFFIVDNRTSSGIASFHGMKSSSEMLAGSGVTWVRLAYVTNNEFYAVMGQVMEEVGANAGGNVKVELFTSHEAAESWLLDEGKKLAASG